MNETTESYECVYCEKQHDNEFSLTCGACDVLRENGLEVEDEDENLLPPKRLRVMSETPENKSQVIKLSGMRRERVMNETPEKKTDHTARYAEVFKDMTDVELLKEKDVWEDRVAYRPARISNKVLIAILGEIGKRQLQRKTPVATVEQGKDARLIEAAPEMLEALKEVMECIRNGSDWFQGRGRVAKYKTAMIIAKAEGGAS